MGRVLRVIFAFLVASLAAGLSMVLFVYTPSELAGDMAADRFGEAALLTLAAATHSAIFAAPFALVGAIVGEGRKISSLIYYAIVGLVIAALGFLVQYSSEIGGQASILNSYALAAFAVTGFVGGVIYWFLAGRSAGGPRMATLEAVDRPRPMPGANKPLPPTDAVHSPS